MYEIFSSDVTIFIKVCYLAKNSQKYNKENREQGALYSGGEGKDR